MTKSNLLVVGPSGSDATFIRFVAQPRSITPSRRTLSHGVEACPHARKVLFRALLTQLHPGRSWSSHEAAPNRGGDRSTLETDPEGKGLNYGQSH